MFTGYENKQKQPIKPTCGIISISERGELQMKLCYKSAGDLDDFVHALRDERITGPAEVYQKALSMGFTDLLLMTRTGRMTPDGANEEPKDKDKLREEFSNTEWSPYGRGTSLFLDMTGEFEAARKAAARRR